MILLVFKEESESIKAIVDSLKDYFKENDYMEDIRYLIIKHLSAVDSVVEIAKIRPDIMLYITFDNNIIHLYLQNRSLPNQILLSFLWL